MTIDYEEVIAEVKTIRREMAMIRQLAADAVNYIRNAEAEIPEKMRRFMNYMHDVHDVKYMYEELGHPVPAHLLRELERLDDRYRQILQDMHDLEHGTGTFEKVRREMAKDPENRWDHTRQLFKPKENGP